MRYRTKSFRHAELVLRDTEFANEWKDIEDVLRALSDDHIRRSFVLHQRRQRLAGRRRLSGLQTILNRLLRDEFKSRGWDLESRLFRASGYDGQRWQVDFCKGGIALEVAFNHNEATAHNLMKPALASELNHLAKQIQTQIGVAIFATEGLKRAGNMDAAVGTFEDAVSYLGAYRSLLTSPILLIGLEAPASFEVKYRRVRRRADGRFEVARAKADGRKVGWTKRLRG